MTTTPQVDASARERPTRRPRRTAVKITTGAAEPTGTAGVADPVPSGTTGTTTASSRRAYARRQRRHQRMAAAQAVRPVTVTSTALDRAPFVAVVIALLGAGIAAVLWLNTMTDEAGLQTSTARANTSDLRLSVEALQRDVAMLDSTGQIAQRASELGLVPAGDAAMLVVDANGAGTVVGDPRVVPGPPPPVDPAAEAAAEAAAQQAAEQAAAQQTVADQAAQQAAEQAAQQAAADQAAQQAAAEQAAAQQAAEQAAQQAAADQAAQQAAAQQAAEQAAQQAAADQAAQQAAAQQAAAEQAAAQAAAEQASADAGASQPPPTDPAAPVEGTQP